MVTVVPTVVSVPIELGDPHGDVELVPQEVKGHLDLLQVDPLRPEVGLKADPADGRASVDQISDLVSVPVTQSHGL